MEITKDEFERYENIRTQGITNMFLVGNVVALSGISREKVLYIMNNYSELRDKFS